MTGRPTILWGKIFFHLIRFSDAKIQLPALRSGFLPIQFCGVKFLYYCCPPRNLSEFIALLNQVKMMSTNLLMKDMDHFRLKNCFRANRTISGKSKNFSRRNKIILLRSRTSFRESIRKAYLIWRSIQRWNQRSLRAFQRRNWSHYPGYRWSRSIRSTYCGRKGGIWRQHFPGRIKESHYGARWGGYFHCQACIKSGGPFHMIHWVVYFWQYYHSSGDI